MLNEQMKYPSGYMDTEIYVTGKQEADIQGLLRHRGTGLIWDFKGLVHLMQIYERLFDSLQFPQSTHRLRDMGDGEDPSERKEFSDLKNEALSESTVAKEKQPTFVVKVKYRQNASWQGTIQWIEGGKTKNFRSTLELIKLMDSVIESDDKTSW